MTVLEVGPGNGRYTLETARRVGPAGNMNTNPLLGFLRTIWLLLTLRIHFHDTHNRTVVISLCQGVYAWQTRQDAEDYSNSIAMRFMADRSDPESVSFRILDQDREKYGLFDAKPRAA